ncbi:uncharacterized protein LOC107633623 [Arachis ipaensis]|uniref:uncharacterized protein LOC107633623 n=1 Tax=Arachis ipaensis TaxID=130454 RepID=UPI0007AF4B30|nr:uncharacterized protein LOC107633623 [Arachis ipaensis]XP_025640739.1 uncharacterized protein LOC112735416 [Arachis hypogaea]
MIRAISKIGELAESENAITVSQSHTATRVCCRAVTSVAQSPPSTSHLRRPASVVRWNNHLYRAAAVVPSKVLHHYLVHLASLSLTLPIASSVEALKVPSSFQSSRISFNVVMSPFFQDMLDSVAGIGPGYKGPSYDTLRVNLLADLKRECQMVVDSYRSAWKETGCTLMADEVIEWIGPDNIVHVVTDNAADYVAAGRLINKKFENIHWSPCVAYCLNLILKDISSMPHISNLARRASKITVFVYNHTVFLSWLRQRTDWREIVRPGATRFATVFITLMSIFKRKSDLQLLVVDTHFTRHKLGMSANGITVSAIILDNKFWNDCFTACQIVSPLIKLLRLVDADDKPSLGIVYEGMLREAPDVMRALLDLVTLHCKVNNLDLVEAMKEIHLYRDRKESFDRPEAVPAAKKLQPDEIDADLDQGGGGGGSSSIFYVAPLAFSGPSSGNEGDDINDANLQ